MSSALIILTQEQVANPAAIERLQSQLEGYDVHRQLLERIIEKAVVLPPNKYTKVIYTETSILPVVADAIYTSLQANGMLSTSPSKQIHSALVIAGFTEENGEWKKLHVIQSQPLKRASNNTKKPVSNFKRIVEPVTPPNEFIDEDDLIVQDQNDFVFPVKCQPPNGKKRRRACKDCTCGLKEAEEAEELVKLKPADLAEIDFTVPGKAVGGCGSCALGDAFRCDGCPYLGLPPFKPGEVVSIDQFGDDL